MISFTFNKLNEEVKLKFLEINFPTSHRWWIFHKEKQTHKITPQIKLQKLRKSVLPAPRYYPQKVITTWLFSP